MRRLPEELIMMRLRGERLTRPGQERRAMADLYAKSEEECLESLRRISGLDFGDDLDLWEQWVNESVRKWEQGILND